MFNFAFTLYEVFGYVLPGGVALLGFVILGWALFVPKVPLGVADFQPGLVTWTAIVVSSYLLGHAFQALGNLLLGRIEKSAVRMTGARWLHDCARRTAAELLQVSVEDVEPRWMYRVLDEYALQEGNPGDRDIFVYREGFYRGAAIALFFLALTLLIRLAAPGTSIRFSKWLFPVSSWQLGATALVLGLLGWLFLRRYKRFVDYRVTRAVLAALVIRNSPKRESKKGHA
jgi:hypothetical protein